MSGAPRDFSPSVEEFDGDAATVRRNALDGRAGEQLNALVHEGLLNDARRVLGMVAQDIPAALHERDAGPDPAEKLRQLAGDDTAAKHDHARGHEIEIEDVVAPPEQPL